MSHHFHNGDMFYCVKSFSKVQFKNNNLFFALMTLVNIFKTPGQTILNGSVHSHRIRGRCLVPQPGIAVLIRGSGSKRISVSFKVGSRPGLKGVAAPLFADLIGIRRLRTVDWCDFC